MKNANQFIVNQKKELFFLISQCIGLIMQMDMESL